MKKLLLVSVMVASWTATTFAALVAHYDMEQTDSPLVDQAGGQLAYAVDSGHLYALQGPPGFGNAVGLNGNGSWQLSVEDSQEINLANDFSVAAWIYLDSSIVGAKTGVNSGLNRIIGDDVAWDADGWSFGVWNDGRVRFTKNGIVDIDLGDPGTVALDQWVHVAATVSSSVGTTIYVNGLPIGTHGNLSNINTGEGRNGQLDP